MAPDELLSARQIAREWGVHLRTVRTWIARGRLPTVPTEGTFHVGVRRSVAESILGEKRPKTTQ